MRTTLAAVTFALTTWLTAASVASGATVVGSGVLVPGTGTPQIPPATLPEITVVIKQAFRAAYSLDEEDALSLAKRAVAMGPEEPSAHRALASILWLDILFKRGAVITDHYLSGGLKEQVALPKPPADLEAEFKRELARSIELAEARVRLDPNSVQARYDAGTAYALEASYTATVDGSVMGAFRLAKRAFNAQEFVLAQDPRRVEAGLVAGTYRYLVSTLTLPARVMAYAVGFGGGKERGIAMIEAATHAVDTHVDARLALLLIYAREGRNADALRIAHELEAEFPRNRLFTLEAGSAAIRAGRAAEAEATLSRGLTAFDNDTRPKIPGERALWLYKRGLARISLNHLADARTDLDGALRAHPTEWTHGRIELQLGKIADLTNDRSGALAAYHVAETLCESHNDVACAGEADRLIKRPFKF